MAKKKGIKKRYDTGTPIKILFAKITEFSVFLYSKYEKAMAIMLAIGSAIIKPDNSGFFQDSQLANAIIKAANNTLAKKIINLILQFSLLFIEMSFGYRKCSRGPNTMPNRFFF